MSRQRRTSAKPQLSLGQVAMYPLPYIMVGVFFTPIHTALPGIYAKHFGLGLSVIATAMFVGRLFDAVTDPLIGYASDAYHARTGTRKPFVVIGGLFFVLCTYFLCVPPENVSAAYFTGWLFVFYLAFTMFEIPHMTWGGELTSNATEKNKV